MNDINKYLDLEDRYEKLSSFVAKAAGKEEDTKEYGQLNGLIQTWRDPYDEGFNTTWAKNVQFERGITILVGCNGIGKTTLLKNIQAECKKKNVPCLFFDNLKDGGSSNYDALINSSSFGLLGSLMMSSEGERINQNIGLFARKIGKKMYTDYSDAKEVWLLFDAVDSGFSVDNIVELKRDLFETILADQKHKDIYIVASANEFELARGEKCLNVERGKYIEFKDYEDYRNFILKTREKKEKRLSK